MWVGIGILVLAVWGVLDTLIKSHEVIEDPETGAFIGFKPPKYNGLWDYIKQKIKAAWPSDDDGYGDHFCDL